ncbi:hypothetical protein J3458_007049 [Metarhizium acridum]|uniref:Uncharacterized protein n=1 Tax=Metarhizium acridum (strain CQMa 102) TaxID=655827 RepID=E9DRM3_METAQ|nr:uncharacterized protein MAC_00392 [Metarhizium acridum CQMa 102]EFY93901.1 hypothetical protein MAC_00392 [Metarhizium acridum CQMa 102]KAG8416464.1 hypothetical protein J3458_007049 [Metarhizium acridum]
MPPTFLTRGTLSPFVEGSSISARSAMPSTDGHFATQPWRSLLVDSKRLAIRSFSTISRRNDDGQNNLIDLMLVILGLVFAALILASLLYLFHRRRRLQHLHNGTLPTYEDVKQTNPRGLTIETTHNGRSSVYYIGRDGQPMLQNPHSPPHSPDNVPQIHITFPEEHDENGRPKSGRVLVVRVGDNAAVGLEPMHEEQLPAYEKESKGQFQSIDMDNIGGLKEKDRTLFQ